VRHRRELAFSQGLSPCPHIRTLDSAATQPHLWYNGLHRRNACNYSFTDPEGWKAELVEFAKPITDILPRKCSNMPTIYRAQSGKVQRPKTDGLITELRRQPCLAGVTEAFASFVCLMWPNSEDAKNSISTKVTLKWIQINNHVEKPVCASSNIKPVAMVKKQKWRNFSTANWPFSQTTHANVAP